MSKSSSEQLYGGTVVSSGDNHDNPIFTDTASEVILFLDVTAVSGDGPTLVVNVETRDEISGKWFLIGNFDAKSGPTTDITYIINGLGEAISCSWVVTGVDPSFTFALNASIKD